MKAHWRKQVGAACWHYIPARVHRAPCGFKKKRPDEVSMDKVPAPRCATCEKQWRKDSA